MKKNVLPSNKTDFATLLHDIDYLRTAGRPELQDAADLRAIRNADSDIAGYATSFGLRTRMFFNATFNQPIKGYTPQQTQKIGEKAWHWVKYHEPYKSLFTKYSVDSNQYEY